MRIGYFQSSSLPYRTFFFSLSHPLDNRSITNLYGVYVLG